MKAITTAALAAFLVLTAGTTAADEALKGSTDFEKRTFKDAAGKELHYRLLKPEGYDPASSTAYPLVIFLHGAGERGDDNEAQLKHGAREFAKPETRKKLPCFLIAPQCPKNQNWAHVERKPGGLTVSSTKDPTEPTGLVLELMDALQKEFRIDPKRHYITGLSMGGFGTWEVLALHPDRFAAAIPICGGGIPDSAEKFARVPIWVFHGTVDGVVKPQFSREMIDALHKAGAKPGYTEYPGLGHDSWTWTYHNPDVLDWLFAQKKD
jgi:predicted peptidase